MQDQSLYCIKCVWLCTDRAPSMVGCYSGATSKIKKVANKNLLSTYCMYPCKHVAFEKLLFELNDIIIRPVKIINYS